MAKEYFLYQTWRKVAIPEWRRILKEAIERKQAHRENYARWVLRDILLDPESQS